MFGHLSFFLAKSIDIVRYLIFGGMVSISGLSQEILTNACACLVKKP
jgi:hypothetical protein